MINDITTCFKMGIIASERIQNRNTILPHALDNQRLVTLVDYPFDGRFHRFSSSAKRK